MRDACQPDVTANVVQDRGQDATVTDLTPFTYMSVQEFDAQDCRPLPEGEVDVGARTDVGVHHARDVAQGLAVRLGIE